jgi:hypothetical protein
LLNKIVFHIFAVVGKSFPATIFLLPSCCCQRWQQVFSTPEAVANPVFEKPHYLMTKQDLVEAISTQTGISKRDLAGWIGTDHSILSRYLSGTRSLPLRALQQLLFLHLQLADLPPLPATTATTEADRPAWQQLAETCLQKRAVLEAQLVIMQQRWQAAAKALQLLATLAGDTVMLTPKKIRWIAEQRYQAEKVMAECNPAAQQKLAVQIALLQKGGGIVRGIAP